jgi:hypothetical protein
MSKDWEIDFNAEYDIFLQGRQKTYLSDDSQFEGETISDVSNHQSHGYGARGSVRFLKKGSLVDYYVEPYVRYWNIKQSKSEPVVVDGTAVAAGVEPKNNTVEVGSKFGVQF